MMNFEDSLERPKKRSSGLPKSENNQETNNNNYDGGYSFYETSSSSGHHYHKNNDQNGDFNVSGTWEYQRPQNLAKEGTIAEREHKKWINDAVVLTNNPYTKEGIKKRNSQLSHSSSFRMGWTTASPTPNGIYANVNNGRRGGGGGEKEVDKNSNYENFEKEEYDFGEYDYGSRYNRDYYINNDFKRCFNATAGPEKGQIQQPTPKPRDGTLNKRSLNKRNLDNKHSISYDSVDKMSKDQKMDSTISSKLKKISFQRSESTLTDSSLRRKNSNWGWKQKAEEEKAAKMMDKNVTNEIPTDESENDEESVKLPSVKKLARKFTKKNVERKKAAEKSSTDKEGNEQDIHSLTARSVPREFREGLKLASTPLQLDSIVKLPPTSPQPPVEKHTRAASDDLNSEDSYFDDIEDNEVLCVPAGAKFGNLIFDSRIHL